MAKNLSERITKRLSAKKTSRTGKNRAAFLAVRDDVRQALDDGWTVKVIWDTLREEGKIEFGYDTFIKYVNQFIRNPKMPPVKPESARPQAVKLTAQVAAKPDALQEARKESPTLSGFNFNPTPNKEDLF